MEHANEKPDFAGMTTNERLFVAGLLQTWDEAATRRDREGMIRLLQRVEVSNADAANIVDQTLAHPEIYLRHLKPTR